MAITPTQEETSVQLDDTALSSSILLISRCPVRPPRLFRLRSTISRLFVCWLQASLLLLSPTSISLSVALARASPLRPAAGW